MKQLNRTKVTVRIRKAAFRNEWYLNIESYPVFVPGQKKPQRIVEALNRTVTSIVWDKKRTARTTETSKSFKPKRDENGVIMCKTEKDQQACLYADGVRKLRQREYDNADLYSDTETAQAEQKERSQQNFIEYFDKAATKRHARSSESIRINWKRTLELIKLFAGNTLPFSKIDNRFAEDFRMFLMTAPQGGNKSGTISRNTAATYFSIFKAGLKQAFVDEFLMVDLSAKIKGIQEQETRREYLTVEELNTLAATPCDHDQMKRAALFSALTGLRHCDIQKMQWKEIQIDGDQTRLNFTQQKTKGVEYMPISPQALELCGEPRKPEQLVFEDFPDPSWISNPLKKWVKAAGITKKITFHCFRHTFATLQLSNGTDIYTVSKMLGHTNVKTTQIYAKVVDEKKEKAAHAIKIKI
ncbi:MAG: site-specific integrase [Prevotellaceae bacterium]|jgi:integrase|nr:site-specific integrase [Prevotellaceae bacterium]